MYELLIKLVILRHKVNDGGFYGIRICYIHRDNLTEAFKKTAHFI